MMLSKKQAFFSWSGGKDSALALHKVIEQQKFEVKGLFTTVNEHYQRIAMHGVRLELLAQQADSIGIPLSVISLPEMPSMEVYEAVIEQEFKQMVAKGVEEVIFGDIFLEDLKLYREKQLAKYGLYAEFPLWGKSSRSIIEEFIALGYRTVVVCAQDGLQDFCGRVIDHDFLNELPSHIDPCGENGEFHTFVFDGPIFKTPVRYELGERVFRAFNHPVTSGETSGFWYIDLIGRSGVER